MSIKVNLTQRVTVSGKDRYLPVVFSGNGRVKPGWVVIDGKEERVGPGAYYIDWTQGTRQRKAVGKDAATAFARKLRKETELVATAQGIALVPEPEDEKRRNLAAAMADYLAEIKMTRKKRTFSAYRISSEYFLESCSKTYIEQLDRKDMVKFAAFLRDSKGLADRTCWNKFNNTMSFLKAMGATEAVGVNKQDWPTFVEEDVETYEKDELDTLFAVCTPEEELIWNYFLMTGKREQEVMYTTWKDNNPAQLTVSVKYKPQWNWKPKGYKEREIPVPVSLMDGLEAVRPKKSGDTLIFTNGSGEVEGHFLRRLKACAKRSGQDPDNFWLHKFRATFCTNHLQAGTDIATVQKWAGHVDLASTMRYLRPARGEGVREKVEAAFG